MQALHGLLQQHEPARKFVDSPISAAFCETALYLVHSIRAGPDTSAARMQLPPIIAHVTQSCQAGTFGVSPGSLTFGVEATGNIHTACSQLTW